MKASLYASLSELWTRKQDSKATKHIIHNQWLTGTVDSPQSAYISNKQALKVPVFCGVGRVANIKYDPDSKREGVLKATGLKLPQQSNFTKVMFLAATVWEDFIFNCLKYYLKGHDFIFLGTSVHILTKKISFKSYPLRAKSSKWWIYLTPKGGRFEDSRLKSILQCTNH